MRKNKQKTSYKLPKKKVVKRGTVKGKKRKSY